MTREKKPPDGTGGPDLLPSDRALLVLDMVEPLVRGERAVPGALEAVRYIRGEVRYFRERGRPVIFACTRETGDDVIQEVLPRTGEPVLEKPAPSAFFRTSLAELLSRAAVRRLTLVGLETPTSVLLTAADAYAHGYEVVVPDPCVCARDLDDHRFALHLIRDVWRPAGAPPGHRPAESSDEGRALEADGDPAPETFGVYVHVPWCRRRCPYCDFYFEVGKADGARFVDALRAEIRARNEELPGRPAATLSLGGGTPTAMDDRSLAALVDVVRAEIGLEEGAEVSLEANPEDVDAARATALRSAGFSRVSLGVQSFEDDVLRFLGRAHTGEDARAAVEACREAGFLRVSVDLIAGVPSEAPGRIEREIERIERLGVGHVSAYLLTVEEGTPLVALIRKGKRPDVDEDAQAAAYERLQELLPAIGLSQYEVSSFAREGEESRHNRLYWGKGSFVGLGPGASSLRLLDDGGLVRRKTTARLAAYLEDPGRAEREAEHLAPDAALRESIAFGLRDLGAGIDLEALSRRHRAPVPPSLAAALDDAARRGWVVRTGARWRLTREGARFSDAVARALLVSS